MGESAAVGSGTVLLLAFLLDSCFSAAAKRRFNAAMSDRYCADAFLSLAVSLRASFRASRVISALRAMATLDNSAPSLIFQRTVTLFVQIWTMLRSVTQRKD